MILCLLQLGCVAIHALAIRKRGGPLSLPGVHVSICVGVRVLLRWVGMGNACVSARASPCYALGGLLLDCQAAGARGHSLAQNGLRVLSFCLSFLRWRAAWWSWCGRFPPPLAEEEALILVREQSHGQRSKWDL